MFILVIIPFATIGRSDEAVHPQSLIRVFPVLARAKYRTRTNAIRLCVKYRRQFHPQFNGFLNFNLGLSCFCTEEPRIHVTLVLIAHASTEISDEPRIREVSP